MDEPAIVNKIGVIATFWQTVCDTNVLLNGTTVAFSITWTTAVFWAEFTDEAHVLGPEPWTLNSVTV